MKGWRGSGASASSSTPIADSRSVSSLSNSTSIRLGRVQPQAPGHRTVFCNDREANHLAKYKLQLHLNKQRSRRKRIRVSAMKKEVGYKGPPPRPKKEVIADWVSNNDSAVRTLPIYVGATSLLAVLFNRTASNIAPVADATSSQSRADLLTIALAVTNILAGLVWLSIRPKSISVVPPRGIQCQRIHSAVPDLVASELKWAWESLSNVTCCRSLVIVYDAISVIQIGYASSDEREGVVDSDKLMQGSIYQGVVKSGSQSYLANLSLYPGKSELPFLPSNTQAVILQPIGDKGIAILGGDTIRGFTTSDQAWITLIGEKLDATLSKHMPSSTVTLPTTKPT